MKLGGHLGIEQFTHLKSAISDEDPRTGHIADSLHKAIASFAFFFYITILDSLLKVTGVLSDYLQGEEILSTAAASTISTQVFP